MTKIEHCPDCGAPMEWEQRREIGREIHKEEVAMMYLDAPEAYAKLPQVLGRPVGQWREEKWCTQCAYRERDGRVVARGTR